MKRNPRSELKIPPFVRRVSQAILSFLDWIAPVVDWMGDQAEKYKAASDAVPPPSQKWLHRRRINTRNMTVTVFLLFLAVMTVVALYLPNRPTYSELEQRNLTEFPKATPVTVLNGEFFDGINTWFADTFPKREVFLAAHSKIEGFYGFRGKKVVGDVVTADVIPDSAGTGQAGEDSSAGGNQSETEAEQSDPADTASDSSAAENETPTAVESASAAQTAEDGNAEQQESSGEQDYSDAETLGALYVNKDTAYEYYNFVQETADNYIAMVNSAAKQLSGKAKVYDMVVPTSMDICVPERVRKGLNTSDQQAALNYLYSGMDSSVTTVDIFQTMLDREEQGDYLYFRTDHHWTAVGAYYAYTVFAPLAGKTALALEDFQEYTFEGFTGSFYRQTESSKMAANPDTVYAYGPKSVENITVTSDDGTTTEYPIIRDGDEMAASLKYLCFIAGDNPFSVIENPNITDGSAIMLVKESFGNCFAPYLAENYQYVYVVDYRYLSDVDDRSLAELAVDYKVDDVLFLNNIGATRESNLVAQMKQFVG